MRQIMRTHTAAALFAVVAVLAAPGRASAQLSIDQVLAVVRAVYVGTGANVGAGSTRESRNAFFAEAIGAVYWGHPVYNPTPDPRWCLKDGGNGRPQSDDVVAMCESRQAWDLIGNAGIAGYVWHTDAIGALPAGQNIYAPPKPRGWAPVSGAPPVPPAGGGGTSAPPAVNLAGVLDALARLEAKLASVEAVAVSARDAADAGGAEARSAAHDARELNAFRLSPEFAAVLEALRAMAGRECFVGRVPNAFRGSSEVRFCLAPAGQ
jgi:hypothetical protein